MYTARMDDKGRLKLPVDFQNFFGAFPEKKIFVTSLDGRIGQLYPISVWRQNERFLSESQEDPDVVANVLFNAQDLGNDAEMDTQGRITVNAQMRDELDLVGQELHLVVVKGRVEILNEAQYQERRRAARPAADENGKRQALENVRRLEQKGLK
jgi:MraZ protein